MPDILCCFKWVIDEAYIKASASGKLDMEWANYKLSDYDRNAIEEAVRLQECNGGSVSAITVGTPDATKGIKDALSRGPEKAYFINDTSFVGLEPSQTASILADVIKAQVPFDVIICGEGSSDLYAQQVGPRLAELLGIPCVTYAQKISMDDQTMIIERKTDEGVEVLQVPLPVLVTVAPDINSPRIPGLKDTLSASKKPVISVTRSELSGAYEPLLVTGQIKAARMERNCVKYNADKASITSLVDALMKAGVLNRG